MENSSLPTTRAPIGGASRLQITVGLYLGTCLACLIDAFPREKLPGCRAAGERRARPTTPPPLH
jgi:hypothetical protein